MDGATDVLERVQVLFNSLLPGPTDLSGTYADDVVFEDPMHRVEGRAELEAYFDRLNRNAEAVAFDFHEVVRSGESAFLTWTMHLRVRRLGAIEVAGATHLRLRDDRVCAHRDYFDVGAMLYEHVPGLGAVLRGIKRLV